MTTLEHYQLDLVNDQPVMTWVAWGKYENPELADFDGHDRQRKRCRRKRCARQRLDRRIALLDLHGRSATVELNRIRTQSLEQ